MGALFHVRIDSGSKPRALAFDLSPDMLKRKILVPFHASIPLSIGGVLLEPGEAEKITILRSDEPVSELALRARRRFSGEQDFPDGKIGDWLILERVADDVTDEYIDVPAPIFGARLRESTENLLCHLVEAERAATGKIPEEFVAIRHMGGQEIQHSGLSEPITHFSWAELDALRQLGLILLHGGDEFYWPFTVSPAGIQYYNGLQNLLQRPAERLESHLRRFLSLGEFARRYPAAYAAWLAAEEALWVAEVPREFSEIGHNCRESMQEFADALLLMHPCEYQGKDKAKTVARMRAVLDHAKGRTGDSVHGLLGSLLGTWGSAVDLVQRQEHGANKEAEVLTWEDARRAVFQTVVVMFEIDRALARGREHVSAADELLPSN